MTRDDQPHGWAAYLQSAVDERREVQGIGAQIGELSIDDAYRVQDALIALKLSRR